MDFVPEFFVLFSVFHSTRLSLSLNSSSFSSISFHFRVFCPLNLRPFRTEHEACIFCPLNLRSFFHSRPIIPLLPYLVFQVFFSFHFHYFCLFRIYHFHILSPVFSTFMNFVPWFFVLFSIFAHTKVPLQLYYHFCPRSSLHLYEMSPYASNFMPICPFHLRKNAKFERKWWRKGDLNFAGNFVIL